MSRKRRAWIRLAAIYSAVALLVCGPSLVIMPGTAVAASDDVPPTVVSLTFDDGFASQLNAQRLLAEHHMNGTFYIISSMIGAEGRLTLPQIQAIQAAGNEIGGHTVSHPHLPWLDEVEQARQVCDSRVALSRDGLTVTSFAYPYGAHDQRTEQIVKDCGYNSARSENGLAVSPPCGPCFSGESMPPADPYSIRTATPVVSSTDLSSIEQEITDAQTSGGWVPIVFHELCDHCSDMAITVEDFAALLDWLQARSGNGITVATVAQVVGGEVQKPVDGPVVTQRPDAELVNASLETADTRGNPDTRTLCWQRSGYGTNTSTWARVSPGHFGDYAEQVSIGSRDSGDQKLIIDEDTGSCAPAVKPGASYGLSAWYKSTAPTRFVAFYRNPQGRWVYWTQSPQTGPSGDWKQFSWQTPPAPGDAEFVSFGLQLADVGTLTTADYGMTLVRPRRFTIWELLGGALLAVVVVPTVTYVAWWQMRRLIVWRRKLGLT